MNDFIFFFAYVVLSFIVNQWSSIIIWREMKFVKKSRRWNSEITDLFYVKTRAPS